MKNKILVIDDEVSICKFLRVTLESNKFEVQDTNSGNDGLREIINYKPDLIILDLGLPDISGFEVLTKIREWSKTPIIVLTVQDSDEDKVKALDAGADDYLTKPFSVLELHARIRVALRHNNSNKQNESPVFKLGPLEIDYSAHAVKVDGETIKLTSTEYDIIKLLSQHVGKVVTHRMILKEIWGPNSIEHTQYLRVYLGQIRKKLKVNENTAELIVTESGVGYRMNLEWV